MLVLAHLIMLEIVELMQETVGCINQQSCSIKKRIRQQSKTPNMSSEKQTHRENTKQLRAKGRGGKAGAAPKKKATSQ